MGRLVDEERRRVWSERLRRFDRSGLSVVAFCRRERVSTPAFYQWRRKLGTGSGDIVGASAKNNCSHRPSSAFVPVQITRATTAVEMRLPNGVRVSLPADDLPLLAAAIVAAGSLAAIGTEVDAC